jgi:hypothetical protein
VSDRIGRRLGSYVLARIAEFLFTLPVHLSTTSTKPSFLPTKKLSLSPEAYAPLLQQGYARMPVGEALVQLVCRSSIASQLASWSISTLTSGLDNKAEGVNQELQLSSLPSWTGR